MIIPINLRPEPSGSGSKFPPQLAELGTDEIVLLELQGSFHTEGDHTGQLAAKLSLQNEKKPTLLIGHNLLEGKVVNLSKPLGVLVKKELKGNADSTCIDHNEEKFDACVIEYDMLAVVKRKIQFSKRPMPMVDYSSPGADIANKKEL